MTELLLHQQVEAQVDRAPDRPAVSVGQDQLSYAELDARANRLAHRLIARGASAETPVAILLSPSLEALVAILAVLKAGGTYIPVDPDYPPDRVRLLLADSTPRFVITTHDLRDQLPLTGVDLIAPGENMDQPATRPRCPATPDTLAYTIYTSGSTGAPKGVMITHRGAVTSTMARRDFYGDDPVRYLMVSSLAFDSSVAGIFWTLTTGGQLVVPTTAERSDPHRLVTRIAAAQPSHVLCVPSLYRVLLRANSAALASLRVCVLAGEEWPADLHHRHLAVLPQAVLANEYGATEVSVWSTGYLCPDAPLTGPPSLGTPITGATMYVVDGDMAPVPPGGTGEVYLGGVGVARGYHGQPALTAARFLPDPFAREPGARLYRTGDLARVLPGGVYFLGRVDEQVKIRGYRIELGEVRAHLCALPHVADAVAVVRHARTPAPSLVGYVVAAGDADLDLTALRDQLATTVPAPLVPVVLVALPQLPLTPNGKIDRNALPDPPVTARPEPAPPATDNERAVVDVVAAVLDVSPVWRDDNFFALGGDSLQAMELALRLRERGLAITAEQVLTCPDMAALAAAARPAAPPVPMPGRDPAGAAVPDVGPEVSDAAISQLLRRIR